MGGVSGTATRPASARRTGGAGGGEKGPAGVVGARCPAPSLPALGLRGPAPPARHPEPATPD